MSGEVCECGLPIAAGKHITELPEMLLPAGQCGAHLHPVWADECSERCVALLKAQLASARRENECWRALVEWVRPTGLRSIEFDIDGFAANDEHGQLRRNGERYEAADATRDLCVKLGLIAKESA